MTALCLHLVHKAHKDTSRNVGISNAGEVNEAGISHHTTEGMECEEGNNVGHEADGEAKGELPEMLCKTESAILEIIDGMTRKEHSGTVHREDAPIGQGASRKVPVTEFTNGVHIVLFFNSIIKHLNYHFLNIFVDLKHCFLNHTLLF